jgi:DNA polymerase III psi subunit
MVAVSNIDKSQDITLSKSMVCLLSIFESHGANSFGDFLDRVLKAVNDVEANKIACLLLESFSKMNQSTVENQWTMVRAFRFRMMFLCIQQSLEFIEKQSLNPELFQSKYIYFTK